MLRQRSKSRLRINISDHDGDRIVRHVTRAVIVDEIIPCDLFEYGSMSDYRLPVGMVMEGRLKQGLG